MNLGLRKRKPQDGFVCDTQLLKTPASTGVLLSTSGRLGSGSGEQVPLRPWEHQAEACLPRSHSLQIKQPQIKELAALAPQLRAGCPVSKLLWG